MMRLSCIIELGRYTNITTGKSYNLKRGINTQRRTEIIFYTYRGKREFISDRDFYTIYEKNQSVCQLQNV